MPNKTQLTLVKIGGNVIDDTEALNDFLIHFSEIKTTKILVHGGGKLATKLLEKMGIKPKMLDGRRITDSETLDVVTMVYAGLINKNIVAKLQSLGQNAVGLTGADFNLIKAHKRPVTTIDYGFAGDIDSVQTGIIAKLLNEGVVPVISPITHDGKAQLLNTNADTIAAETAKALAPIFDVTLIYCFEKEGVMNENKMIETLDYGQFKSLQQQNIISKGMIPKLDNAFAALKAGVKSVLIANAEGINSGNGTKLSK